MEDNSKLKDLFHAHSSAYWSNHYLFDKKSKPIIKSCSESFKNMLLINVVSPFLLCYGMEKNKDGFKEKALNILENTPFEKNKITQKWLEYGMPSKSALESQGLLSLKGNFCEKKKCLKCPIGVKIMNF